MNDQNIKGFSRSSAPSLSGSAEFADLSGMKRLGGLEQRYGIKAVDAVASWQEEVRLNQQQDSDE